jgi:Zn-dependent metalloprotease
MKTFTIFSFLLLQFPSLWAQTPLKQIKDQPTAPPKPLQISNKPGLHSSARLGNAWEPSSLASLNALPEEVESFHIAASGSFWIDMKPNQLWQGRASINSIMKSVVPMTKHDLPVEMSWKVTGEEVDENQVNHIRVVQTLGGIPIHRQDMVVHISGGQLRDMNGFIWTAGVPKKLPAPGPPATAIEAARHFLSTSNVAFVAPKNLIGFALPEDEASLVWYPKNGKLILAYEVDMHPNALDHWKLFLDAVSYDIIESYSQLCTFSPVFNKAEESCQLLVMDGHSENIDYAATMTMMDGATVTTDQDLLGQNRTVNGYQVGSNFFMIDATRSGMYQPSQSVMPDEPTGVIWTIDALNTSPQNQNFEVVHVTNTNNNWKNLEVSAHFNAGKAYEYFLQTFTRNSINGNGGNIISIINVAEDNGAGMDNAFWNGSAMFYGNGNTAFKELARGLDVAGHEMSHGVIQNTANLEYVGQSGALNESYADVFGALIDRDDWKMGEDVVKPSVFPSGALRDLSNPNNGGNSLGDPGWQPKHMNEFANLPNTPEGDNGGVHVNSGIPNRAFYILATNIGREKAEQIYYKALRDYLVKSSQFVDMRLAVEKAAKDLHGNSSPELDAVRNAFNTVGIGGGTGGEYEEDIEVNDGEDFIIATDEGESDLYWIPPTNPNQFVKMDVPAPISRPSFTDNGASCVYVDDQNNMILINFDWSQGLSYGAFYLENDPQGIWRNVVVSKGGERVAYITADLENAIYVFDFVTGANDFFALTNPTTAEGGLNTGDVLYPDVLEWSYSGEYVMYDALSRIESNFGDGIEYWDIAFIHAWDNASNELGSGQIGKLFSTLPENVSIGNPSFAKNSPYIIVFDFLEAYYDIFGQIQVDYIIKAANIEAQELSDIFQNTTVGFPNYSSDDSKILFTYDDNGSLLLATIDVEDDNKIQPVPGTEIGLLSGAQKGIWFATGEREFTSTTETSSLKPIMVAPVPATDYINVDREFISAATEFTIREMTGRTVKKGIINQDARVDISTLAAGSYILLLQDGNGLFYRAKFVKQ